MAKPLLTMNIHFENEGQECKTSPVRESSGKGEENGEGKQG
jgi:hypothetical protein